MSSKNHFSNPSSLHIFMSNYGVTSNGLLQNINAMSLFGHQTNLVSIQYHGITLLSIYKSNSFLRPLIVVSLCGQFSQFSRRPGASSHRFRRFDVYGSTSQPWQIFHCTKDFDSGIQWLGSKKRRTFKQCKWNTAGYTNTIPRAQIWSAFELRGWYLRRLEKAKMLK